MKSIAIFATVLVIAASALQALAEDKPDWAKKLQFQEPPKLYIDAANNKVHGPQRIIIENKGTETSHAITVECTIFDDEGTTVGMLSGVVGPIRPGKTGLISFYSYEVFPFAKNTDCEIGPGMRADLTW